MVVNLYKNTSENNRIGKNYTFVSQKECILKKDCSMIYPIIEISEDDDIKNSNYIYIPTFDRYYFIENLEPLIGGRVRIKARVDVLESFKDRILDVDCIINETEKTGLDAYLPSNNWVANVKNSTKIINFPNGLSENGEFILITAGG